MKATILILIFSGLISLKDCSSEFKLNIPDFSTEKNIKTFESKKLKFENVNDSLLSSANFLPCSYLKQS